MKIIPVLSYFVLAVALALIGYVSFNLLYLYPTITIESPAAILNKGTIHTGDILLISIKCDKTCDQSATVIRSFVNDIVYVLPSYESNYAKGKHDTISYSTKVPSELPAGEYYVRTTLVYKFPPFRVINYSFDTEKFTVER